MSGANKEANTDTTQRHQSSIGTSPSSLHRQQNPFSMNQLDIPQLNMPQFGGQMPQFPPNFGVENTSRRAGIPPPHPPISPYSHIPVNRTANQQIGLYNFSTSPGPSHSRSLSQPTFFALDSLPPLSPSPYVSADATMEDRNGNSHPFARGGSSLRIGETLPPRKAHRRSNSDIPFGFTSIMQSSPVQLVIKEESSAEGMGERKLEGEVVDDLFSAYMNLENIDAFNGGDSSETKTNGGDSSDNEATSSVNGSGSSSMKGQVVSEKREGIKRNAVGDIAPTTRHYRSVSMDSFMGNVNFGDELHKMTPSLGALPGQLSPANSIDVNSDAFDMEFGNGEFSGAELKKIMANEKLSEIALSDPKRAKRILANRQSAARSKERKMRYIAELEHKVQTLQTEATTLSAQLTLLQRDSAGLSSQNNELKFRLQAMAQQAELRDALNKALTGEVQRLKHATAELNGDTSKFQQLSISNHMFQLLTHQTTQLNMHQFQQQQQQQSKGNNSANHETEK